MRIVGSTDVGLVVESTDGSSMIALKDNSTSGDYYNGVGAVGNELFLKSNNAERVRIDSSGNVGIGATDPLRKLHVVGSMAVNEGTGQYYGILMAGGESNDPRITIGDWHNSSGSIMWDSSENVLKIDSQHSTANRDIVFTGNDFATEYMRVNATGLGIGASPDRPFYVKRSGDGNVARFTHSGSTGSVDIYSAAAGGLINVRNGSGTSILELDGRSTAGASKLGAAVATTIAATGAITANNGKPVLTENGSWIGDLGSNGYTKAFTYDVSSCAYAWVTKGGQMSTLLDGSYFAYESNSTGGGGFWSSYDSSYGNACGIKASGTSELSVKQIDGGACNLKVPSGLFTVNSTSAYQATVQYDASTRLRISVESSGRSRFYTDNSANVGIESGGLYVQPTKRFYLDGGNDTYIAESSGNVISFYAGGVGTIRANVNTSGLNVPNNGYIAAGDSNDIFIRHDGNGHLQSNAGTMFINQVSNNSMIFSTNNTERIRIEGGGDIGINENNPDSRVHISHSSLDPDGNINGALQLDGSYGGGLVFRDTKYSGIWNLSNGTQLHFGVGGTSDVGSPGSNQGRFMMQDNGTFHADADVVAYSTSVGSDIKLKKNVEDIGYGLDDVLKMRAVEFNWKEKRQGKHDIGVIAQELEKIIPEVVQEVQTIGGSNDTHKVVDYAKLTSVLIKAIQQQQEEIELLKANYSDLKYNRR